MHLEIPTIGYTLDHKFGQRCTLQLVTIFSHIANVLLNSGEANAADAGAEHIYEP